MNSPEECYKECNNSNFEFIMSIKKTYHVLVLLCAVLFVASCKEVDDTVEEFPNWQAVNEAKFTELYNTAKQKIAAGDTSWKIIKQWSMPAEPTDFNVKPENCIVVEVIKEGTGSGCPIYSDAVRCHYQGRLLPSTSYKDGMVFDQSYYGTFNEATAEPSRFSVSSVVDGFSTALQNMHIGDAWRVYIPYQLGYGNTQSEGSSIPACSTLIFEIRLVKYGPSSNLDE